jgi:hypothetical protein
VLVFAQSDSSTGPPALLLLPQRDTGGEGDRPHTIAVEIRPYEQRAALGEGARGVLHS